MKVKFYILGWDGSVEKISKKKAMLLITKDQFEEAKNDWLQDPNISIEYMVQGGRLLIEFSI